MRFRSEISPKTLRLSQRVASQPVRSNFLDGLCAINQNYASREAQSPHRRIKQGTRRIIPGDIINREPDSYGRPYSSLVNIKAGFNHLPTIQLSND